ncbi:MAG: hypothetical protein FRX49_10364 [Trebouxia sp. A1-2]|nr:MAG: hypothetical protein FRX49_10364 [Trebouxia sp. A1-2]
MDNEQSQARGPVLSHTKNTMPGSKTYPSAIVEGNGEVGICGLVGLYNLKLPPDIVEASVQRFGKTRPCNMSRGKHLLEN